MSTDNEASNNSNHWKGRQRSTKPPTTVRCWKLLRHCLCTTGWYPVFVAPFITAGLILSLYSSLGCQFIELNVGFTPSNSIHNQSELVFGLFYYHNEELRGVWDTKYTPNNLLSSCVSYSDEFENTVVDQDRTWKVARVISMIAITSSLFGFLTICLVNLCPAPVRCLWPGILLPSTMLSFIAEGSKFLIFDVALCQNAVWFPSGVDSLPETAESCNLGISAYFGIAAAACHLLSLLSVCLKTPVTRELDPDYGVYVVGVHEASTEREEHYREEDEGNTEQQPQDDILDVENVSSDDEVEDGQSDSSRTESENHTLTSSASLLKTLDDTIESHDSSSTHQTVSDSRMEVLSRMRLSSEELSESRQMIADLVNELDVSLKPE